MTFLMISEVPPKMVPWVDERDPSSSLGKIARLHLKAQGINTEYVYPDCEARAPPTAQFSLATSSKITIVDSELA